MTHESFFNKALKPYRAICTHISLDLCKTNNEKVVVSQMAADFHKYWLQQTSSFQTISLSFIMMLLSLIDLVSYLFSMRILICATSIACLLAAKKVSKKN